MRDDIMANKTSSIVNIEWKPDKTSNIPIFKQIVIYISNKISKGDWLIGNQLPPQRALAKMFDVNRSTIVAALEELTSLGILEGKSGHGTTIINNTWSLLMSASPPNWQRYIDFSIHKANSPTIQTINKLEFVDGITRLSTGEISPELFPKEMMKKVLQRVPERAYSLNYLEPLGLFELRRILSQHLTKYGIYIPPSCILIVSGSLQALQLISLCMLQPGSTIFIEIPSYLKSLNVFQSAGMKLRGIPMDSNGIMPWILNKKDNLEETSLLYTIPTFHNPTGRLMTETRRQELLDWCKTNRLPIIEDDAYRELWINEEPPPPLKAYDKNGMVLYMGSISKSLAPGLRLGWLAGPESIVERLGDVKMQTDYGASSLSQWALTEWMESGLYEQHLLILRKHLKERRDLVLHTLDTHFKEIATWNTPAGGYYIWLRLNKNISTDRLFEIALSEKLLINPGSIYDFSNNQHIRISYSYASPDELKKGLIKLSELIEKMYQHD
jgi:GntR family transcriptional regulator of abcA and norABC